MKPRAAACTAIALTLASLSCFGGDRADALATMPSDTIPLVLGTGDLLITTADSTMQLGLVGDTVLMQFGEKLRQKLRAGLDTTHPRSSNRFVAAIERMVMRKVSSALGRRLVRPLAEIDSVTLDGNLIRFSYRDRRGFSFEDMKNDDRSVLESFRPADARQFVAAVRARKTQRAPTERR
jgi:hypothetical protein